VAPARRNAVQQARLLWTMSTKGPKARRAGAAQLEAGKRSRLNGVWPLPV
jgi:hypothetical protein